MGVGDRPRDTALLLDSSRSRYAGYESDLRDFRRPRFPRDRYQAAAGLLRPANRILDVGCGGGYLLYNLRASFGNLFGVDFLEERVERTSAAFQQRQVPAMITVASLESGLPWPDGYFDAVVWTDVVQFIPDLLGAFSELARLLSPGGQLVTTAPNLAYLKRICSLLIGRFPATSAPNEGLDVRPGTWYDDGTLHYFTLSLLRKLYRRAHIRPDAAIGFGRLGFLHQLRPELLSGGICISGTKAE